MLIECFCHEQHDTTFEILWPLLTKGKLYQEVSAAWTTRAVSVRNFMVDHVLWCNPAKEVHSGVAQKGEDAQLPVTSLPALPSSARPWPSTLWRVWLPSSAGTWCVSYPGTQEGGF